MGKKPDDLLLLAIAAHRRAFESRSEEGLRQARAMYEIILARSPKDAGALHFSGVLLHQMGETDAGIARIEKALAAKPRDVEINNNLGNVLREAGRHDQAAAAYRRAIAVDPSHATAFSSLAAALMSAGRAEEAIPAFERALELAPANLAARRSLASLFTSRGRFREGAQQYRRAIERHPADPELRKMEAFALIHGGRVDQARAALEEWLALRPADPVATHMLASIGAVPVPQRATDDYLRATFDPFASSFDEHLTERLRYMGPELVGRALREQVPAAAADLDVLDAGCGTGLAAPHLRPYARKLTGVDLSAKMLARARTRGAYDALHEEEITTHLARAPGAYGLIVSIDVLIYFGPLEEVLAGVARALIPGGIFAATFETLADDAGAPHRLDPHGRYVHAERYVRELLAANGLELRSLDHEQIRDEGGSPVAAFVVTARRP